VTPQTYRRRSGCADPLAWFFGAVPPRYSFKITPGGLEYNRQRGGKARVAAVVLYLIRKKACACLLIPKSSISNTPSGSWGEGSFQILNLMRGVAQR
jgi:hypothetical protein